MDQNDYTGWRELRTCAGGLDGHKCRTWLEALEDITNIADKGEGKMKEEKASITPKAEENIYVEVAVPELDPENAELQQFLIIGSNGDSSNVTVFLGGRSIVVSTEMLRRACYRATDVGSPY